MANFGRTLTGTPDVLPGFELKTIEVTDEATVALSGTSQHTIAKFTGRASDTVSGTAYALTHEELRKADGYEAPEYTRVAVTLQSGLRAWVYVDAREDLIEQS